MRIMFALALPLLLASSPAEAKARPATAKAKPAELKWGAGPPGLPAGAQMAVVSGNPGKAGKFTIQLKMPSNYSVPAHGTRPTRR